MIVRVFNTYYGIRTIVFYYIGPDDVLFFLFEQGVRMGCSFGSFGFDLCIHPVLRGISDLPSEAERPDKVVLRALTDDFPMAIPPPLSSSPQDVRDFYSRILNLFKGASDLLHRHTGGSFNILKCSLLLHTDHPPIPSDMPDFPFETVRDGIILAGAPVGTDAFIHRHFDKELSDFASKSAKLAQLHPQLATRILKDSLIPAYQYLFQLTPPALVQEHARQFDQTVEELMITSVLQPQHRPPPVSCSDSRLSIGKMILHMPVKHGGLGLKSFRLLSYTAFWSSLACCVASGDPGLTAHSGALAHAATSAHGLLSRHLTAHGDFASKASSFLPHDPLTALRPEFYKQVLSTTTHLQKALSDVVEAAQLAAVKRAVFNSQGSNPSFRHDWTALFSHGANRSACLFARLNYPSNRMESDDFVDLARFVCLLPQLPHMLNADHHPQLDYHAERCSLLRHTHYGPPLQDSQCLLDLHGAHARSNCPSTKAGVAAAHTGLKHALTSSGIQAGMYDKNEPTHEALLGVFTSSACAKLFPDRTTQATSERACRLVEESFRIRAMPFDQARQDRQAELDHTVASLPAATGLRLDVMLRQPPSSREPPLWLDMATVHPLADSNMGRERARTQRAMAEFIRDPVSSASAGLRRQPSLQATVNFKKLKYASLVRAATLQANARREKAPVFVPLVVSTLGQVHGLQTVSSILGSAYIRKLELLGPRSDGVEPDDLARDFKRNLRESVLVQTAKGFAQSLRMAGLPYGRPG